jgi:transposase-like protein
VVDQVSQPTGIPERAADQAAERGRAAPEGGGTAVPREVEVIERASRRRFDAAYKLRVLAEADAAPAGGIGALLRREGLYSSHLITWRRQRDIGALAAMQPKKRGPKSKRPSTEAQRITQLERENERLRQRLKQAETIIEFQKKVHEILGIPLQTPPNDDGS